MITVRFQDGTAVQYNSANYAVWQADGSTKLYSGNESNRQQTFIARVPSSAIVEFVAPCRVYNPVTKTDFTSRVDAILAELRQHSGYKVEALKRALSDYNIKTQRWKG